MRHRKQTTPTDPQGQEARSGAGAGAKRRPGATAPGSPPRLFHLQSSWKAKHQGERRWKAQLTLQRSPPAPPLGTGPACCGCRRRRQALSEEENKVRSSPACLLSDPAGTEGGHFRVFKEAAPLPDTSSLPSDQPFPYLCKYGVLCNTVLSGRPFRAGPKCEPPAEPKGKAGQCKRGTQEDGSDKAEFVAGHGMLNQGHPFGPRIPQLLGRGWGVPQSQGSGQAGGVPPALPSPRS